MSWILILGIVLFVGGVAGVLFMIITKLSTLTKLPSEPQPHLNGKIIEEIKTRLNGIKYSNFLPLTLAAVEKNLRKFRLFILKIDNLFGAWIKNSREKSETWTIRSKAWMEHRRLRKKEKTQVLEHLDKMEVSQTLEKIDREVAKDEDQAFKEKVEIVNSVEEEKVIEPMSINEMIIDQRPDEEEILTVSEDEKKHIDAIAKNPKDIDAYRALGFIYLEQKNYSDARACFRRVLKLNQEDEEVKQKMEEIKGLRSKKTSGNM